MTVYVRQPTLAVTIDGTLLDPGAVLSAKCSFGYDISISQATITVPELTGVGLSTAGYWQEVVIYMSATLVTGSLPTQRFVGYITGFNNTFYPRSVDIICSGQLQKAQMQECTDPLGVDLSNNGAGKTDQAIVKQILDQCAISYISADVHGTGKLLGTYAVQDYRWNKGETALAVIQRLDEICLGYKTFDDITGKVSRLLVSAIPAGTPAATFTTGLDIFDASSAFAILPKKNYVIVTGATDPLVGFIPIYATSPTSMPATPLTQRVDSPLIEKTLATDPGDGVSCKEVADYWLAELNDEQIRVPFTTPRDDGIAPGATIAIAIQAGTPNRLDTTGLFFVQNVALEINDQNQFTQSLICVSGPP